MKTVKKTENTISVLSVAEQRRYEEIVTIQNLLAEGFAPVQIKEMLQTTYFRIRRYATGDPLNMCRFDKPGGSQLDRYRTEIIEFLSQNLLKKDIFEKLMVLGYTGKLTALKDYCRKLIAELQLQYTPRKNTIGVTVKPDQKPDMHYITRQDLFKHLWSGQELPEADVDYLFNKFPALTELKLCISHFRDIYTEKNIKLLDWFIVIYAQCFIKTIASFANGLLSDIAAVTNSVTSPLSNGFVEGINNKIKVIKRTMYGRAKIKLLSAKVVQQLDPD